jgi:tRNA A37 N6-isopentenylltransferase MiaA
VKKQLTWFRRDDHSEVRLFHWVDASQPLVKKSFYAIFAFYTRD